jgi:hypothetical protein
MAYKHNVGDLVSVPSAAGKHVPAEIFKIAGDEFFVDYICNHYGRRVFKVCTPRVHACVRAYLSHSHTETHTTDSLPCRKDKT